MRYTNALGILKVDGLSDLKYGEYMCTECKRIIGKVEDVITNNKQQVSINGINFCSARCRSENNKGYDRMVTSIFN